MILGGQMQLGWIDFSKADRDKTLDIINLFSKEGTLDELGIASIRDGFSNLFFPGTTTIQTRAKYFFVVPYALQQLERSNKKKLLNELKSIEKDCCKAFLDNDNNEKGIIGKTSYQNNFKTWVKRTPASVYWSGLKRYGIFIANKDLSLTEYLALIEKRKEEKDNIRILGNNADDNVEENLYDDKNAGYYNYHSQSVWNMPLYEDNWIDNLTIELTQKEANFLKKQIIKTCEDSLLALVLKNDCKKFMYCNSFNDLEKIINKFPFQIRKDYKLAIDFSKFMNPIFVYYNSIISKNKNKTVQKDLKKINLKETGKINIEQIIEKFKNNSPPSFSNLERFLIKSKKFMNDNNSEALKKLIQEREINLKGQSRAKTTHVGQFNSEKWYGEKELNYRFSIARGLVRDIWGYKEENNVKSN